MRAENESFKINFSTCRQIVSCRYSVALDHYSKAFRQREAEDAAAEQTLRLGLKVAAVQLSSGEAKDATFGLGLS